MRRHADTDLLALAGALALLWAMSSSPQIIWGDSGLWLWPVPDLEFANPFPGGATPLVVPSVQSQEFRRSSGSADHLGVDLMYHTGSLRMVLPGLRNTPATSRYSAPPGGVPIAAARDGTVRSVELSPRGHSIVVDHGGDPEWMTFYQHLDSVTPGIVRGARVGRGQQLGYMGIDPLDPQRVKHLHFATWYRGWGNEHAVDPSGAMASWNHWRAPYRDSAMV